MSEQRLNCYLQTMLSDAKVSRQVLPHCNGLALWLIDPAPLKRPFTDEEVHAIQHFPAYWSFCWASGLALAQTILQRPELVAGKRVLDFGAGSGVVGIAALMTGAKEVVFCDIDPQALESCAANAALNQLNGNWRVHGDLFNSSPGEIDLLIAADVLYDAANLPLLTRFRDYADDVLVADSRVKNFNYPPYQHIDTLTSCTLPDLDESQEFRQVRLYQAQF
ncbi:protein methyltransferase [Bacterioplanes sanyensis]|uniref:Protein methyltransferase n=1 Tax=Bacterioplanes sanyensis TaxID=1249553 RepID=A0A222FKN0_9GAMM|nr:50S ribosomal protein L11 methyltransferase [Bacterioplanes sanyensis]ASP39309.1 protein methyltransferase [Bacterioplanes sanyensis]